MNYAKHFANGNCPTIWCSAPPHNTRELKNNLNKRFEDLWIGNCGIIN